MTRVALVSLMGLALVSAGCGGGGWQAGSAFFADPARVAAAIGDPPPGAEREDLVLPVLPLPHHTRNCCAFGMDLRVDFAGVPVPLFDIGNVLGVDELGAHAYTLADGAPDHESNGLVYTCRGGWIDTAHVREQADHVVFLASTIARTLESGSVTVIPGYGAPATIVVAPVPAELIEREGRLNAAMSLAAWAEFRISIWHEVSTWFGYQSVPGFSEQPSAFSPEDLYSNALGIRLGLAVLAEHDFRSDVDYDLAIESFLLEALRRLGAIPRIEGREVMAALDGRWWDSTRRLPDNLLVTRRRFPPEGDEILPWRADDALDPGTTVGALERSCRGSHARSLIVPDRLGRRDASSLVTITWAPEGWADATFPFPHRGERTVTERDLDELVARAHAAMELVFGAGFDSPAPRAAAPQ